MQLPAIENLLAENRGLKRALEEVTILNEVAQQIAAQRDSRKIMDILVRRSIEALEAEQGVVTLVDFCEVDGKDWAARTLVRDIVGSSKHEAFRPDQLLLGWMFNNRRALVVSDPHTDSRVHGVKWHPAIRSLICVPLQVRAKLIGVITLYNKRAGLNFTNDDKRLLSIIASQSAQVIENHRLQEEEQQLALMNHELQLAAKVQASLLPDSTLRLGSYEVCGSSLPAHVVGGDYFDFIRAGDNRVVVCLGDVEGKGLPAALLMANLQATLRSQFSFFNSPEVCVSRVNLQFFDSMDSCRLVTLFYSVLDCQSHELCYCNAGHNHPLLFKGAEQVLPLETGGTVLGFRASSTYSRGGCSFAPKDFLVIYSDGITETFNPDGEEFGVDRLVEVCSGAHFSPARAILNSINQAVSEFAGGIAPGDDRTLVVIKRHK